jgi:hypothetical protein
MGIVAAVCRVGFYEQAPDQSLLDFFPTNSSSSKRAYSRPRKRSRDLRALLSPRDVPCQMDVGFTASPMRFLCLARKSRMNFLIFSTSTSELRVVMLFEPGVALLFHHGDNLARKELRSFGLLYQRVRFVDFFS